MDESNVTPKEKVTSTFIDDAIKMFAKHVHEDTAPYDAPPAGDVESVFPNHIPLEGAITKSQQTWAAGAPGSLKPHQEYYETRNYTKEDIERIIRQDSERNNYRYAAQADPCKKDRMVDNGCPMLSNLDAVWAAVGEVFTEYKTANTCTLLGLLEEKCPGMNLSWEAGGNLMVKGATTNIKHSDVKAAFAGLQKITSDKVADQIIASVLAKKIKKLF
jgi:hypothetical protein